MCRSVRIAVVVALLGVDVYAADGQSGPTDLRLATLEELMSIEVTSASRREQRVEDVPRRSTSLGGMRFGGQA